MAPILKDGWQCKVKIYKNYVIKIPKTKSQMRIKIKNYLTKVGKLDELERRLDTVYTDLKQGPKILKSSSLPNHFVADAKFLKSGRIKQKRVLLLTEKLEKLVRKKEYNKAREMITKSIKFYHLLWSYGIHEKTLKFYSNFGVDGEEIVMIDFLEITDDKEKVVRRLQKHPLIKIEYYRNRIPDKLLPFFIKEANKYLTLKYLKMYWNSQKVYARQAAPFRGGLP